MIECNTHRRQQFLCCCVGRRAWLVGAAATLTGCATAPQLPAPSGWAFPDSAPAKAAESLLAVHADSVMVAHCRRSYVFAEALGEKAGWKPDQEVLYIGALLHDLGLLPAYEREPGDFEIVGARIAEQRLLVVGAGDRLAAAVKTAIELHTDVTSSKDARPEVALLHMGTFADVTGARIDQLPAGRLAAILEAFPRKGTRDVLVKLLRDQAALKPQSKLARTMARVDVEALVRRAPFAE